MAVPTASTCTGARGKSGAASAREMTNAVLPSAGPALVALGRSLPDCAEAKDVVGVTGRHRRARRDHRPELSGVLEPAVVPVEVETEGVLQLDHADAREPRRRVHVPGVCGEAVDVLAREAGVLDGVERGVDREVERVAVEAAPHVGLTDAGDDGRPLCHFDCSVISTALSFRLLGHRSVRGLNSGSHTSSWWSKLTSTGMPT